MQVTYILLKVEHSKPIADLTDIAAGRLYTYNNVENVTAMVVTAEAAHSMELDSKVDA